ncbi:hypothetical protein [Guptibacillus hwajinpoensis]|uniref:hypothetical protein n=1 Tax=Guptibacillus hwajinpoensis TaxID=208199 RepID=UPI001CFDAC44|nr:hypothetical protein [Pseudalkalibacillus hwajinpoensis]WLR61809.1 hypothetical protein LC071_07585 [Pseudalkalibacillus hwajinpoensis]
MTFPVIHTNFWDAVLAIPLVMILTQLIKIFTPIPRTFVPTLAIILGLLISVFYSHRHHLVAGLFMGYFYGYAAIGNYASLKTSLLALQKKRRKKEQFS